MFHSRTLVDSILLNQVIIAECFTCYGKKHFSAVDQGNGRNTQVCILTRSVFHFQPALFAEAWQSLVLAPGQAGSNRAAVRNS